MQTQKFRLDNQKFKEKERMSVTGKSNADTMSFIELSEFSVI